MKTLESIIEREIRAHIDDNRICQELLTEGLTDTQAYDAIINNACIVAERFIVSNFEDLLKLATIEEEPEEDAEELKVPSEKLYAISDEDEEMLKFIES